MPQQCRPALRRDRVGVFISRAGLARHHGAVGSSDGRDDATTILAATLVGGGAG